MKRILIINSILLVFAVSFSACKKIEKDTLPAIKKLIKENKWGGQVVEYEYNNNNIYIWWFPGCIDCFTVFYNEKGIELWKAGGFTGKGEGTPLEGFYENAIFKRVIWTEKRAKKYLENDKQ